MFYYSTNSICELLDTNLLPLPTRTMFSRLMNVFPLLRIFVAYPNLSTVSVVNELHYSDKMDIVLRVCRFVLFDELLELLVRFADGLSPSTSSNRFSSECPFNRIIVRHLISELFSKIQFRPVKEVGHRKVQSACRLDYHLRQYCCYLDICYFIKRLF